MSKANGTPSQIDEEDRLPEYDFRKGVRGKHYQAYRQGYSVTVSHQDGTITTQEFSASRIITNLTTENHPSNSGREGQVCSISNGTIDFKLHKPAPTDPYRPIDDNSSKPTVGEGLC
jgi:hypothetical protein